MPAFYAHYRFGKEAERAVCPKLKEIIEKYHKQFETGLQGPDIFFFYKPYTYNKVVRYGHHLHQISAYPFFEHALCVLEKHGRNSGQYAYLMGVICHFVLDGACHPYIGEMIEETGVRHLEIEEEFEKHLLRADGKDPVGFPLSSLIAEDDDVCSAVAPFYQDMTVIKVKQSLHDLKRVKELLCAPGAVKQSVINTLMKMTGRHKDLKGLMHQRKDNPKCKETNEELLKRFEHAVDTAVEMMKSFDDSLISGEALNMKFGRNYL